MMKTYKQDKLGKTTNRKMHQEASDRSTTPSHKALVLLAAICLAIVRSVEGSSTQMTQQDKQQLADEQSNLHDPIVWDASSWYKDTQHFGFRRKRSTLTHQQPLVDACQSKTEVLTPYYATNSKGKLRTVVHNEPMQQAIQVETCVRSTGGGGGGGSGNKCNAQLDCGCEQKYKWHRLLVLDPRDSGASRGLFMDWFLFPSSCVCRCKSSQSSSKQFLRAIKKPDSV